MPFTQAFMAEVMRYRTVLPFGVPRMAIKNTKVGKYIIPAVRRNFYIDFHKSKLIVKKNSIMRWMFTKKRTETK